MLALEVQNLSKVFKNKNDVVNAVDNVSFSIQKGKITCLLGENGAGKSTLIKCLVDLIIPDRGTIHYYIGNNPLSQIGCILEGERNVYYYLTVYDNLFYFGKLNKLRRNQLNHRIDEVLEVLDLSHKKFTYVAELSRGMQQKVALAIVMIRDPELLILDEPTLGLDVQSTNSLMEYLLKLTNAGKTIILTTHQMDVAEQLADQIILYKDGRIIKDISKQELFASFQNESYVNIVTDKKVTGYISEDMIYRIDMNILSKFIQKANEQNIQIKEITTERQDLKSIFVQVIGEYDD